MPKRLELQPQHENPENGLTPYTIISLMNRSLHCNLLPDDFLNKRHRVGFCLGDGTGIQITLRRLRRPRFVIGMNHSQRLSCLYVVSHLLAQHQTHGQIDFTLLGLSAASYLTQKFAQCLPQRRVPLPLADLQQLR